jgi:hypothetical protein
LPTEKGKSRGGAPRGNKNGARGPRIGRAGNRNGRPRGKPFPKGQNSHTPDEVFRRGPDHIARGSVRLLYGQVQFDEREALYRQLCRIARSGKPMEVIALTEAIGNRTEGRPVQIVQQPVKRTTIFRCAEDGPGVNPRQLGEPRVIVAPTVEGPEGSPLAGMELGQLGP